MTELVTCRWFDRAEHARRRTFTPPPDRGAARRAMVAMMKMTKTAIEHGDAWFARRYVAGRKALTTLTTASVARASATPQDMRSLVDTVALRCVALRCVAIDSIGADSNATI